MNLLLLAQAAVTLFLTGVIWFVQIVHYPLMAGVGTSGFAAFEHDHSRLTSRVVVAPMSPSSRSPSCFCGEDRLRLRRALRSWAQLWSQ